MLSQEIILRFQSIKPHCCVTRATQPHTKAALSFCKKRRYLLTIWLGGPLWQCEYFGGEKNFFPYRDSNPMSPSPQPKSLYSLLHPNPHLCMYKAYVDL